MIITSVYGISPPSKKSQMLREKKVAQVIASMGEKYILHKTIKKHEVVQKGNVYVTTK